MQNDHTPSRSFTPEFPLRTLASVPIMMGTSPSAPLSVQSTCLNPFCDVPGAANSFCAACQLAASNRVGTVDARLFYENYYGHLPEHLRVAYASLRSPSGDRALVFLTGDSSLDNKSYVHGCEALPASGGWERILAPPRALPDVAAWLSRALIAVGLPHGVLNCAVEEATAAELAASPFVGPTAAVSRAVTRKDVVILSAGGNDVVLRPTLATVSALAAVLSCGSDAAIDCGDAIGFGTLQSLFYSKMQAVVEKLCAHAAPAIIIVLFPYYPQVYSKTAEPGWADTQLGLLGYNANPERLQRLMRAVFRHATQAIRAPTVSTRIIHIPLYDVLDSSAESNDYIARVEPSASGGEKIALRLAATIAEALGSNGSETTNK